MLITQNVNTAYNDLVYMFQNWEGVNKYYSYDVIVKNNSRNGPVLKISKPWIIEYTHPWQRVLMLRKEANPFFHLYEALWMLAGRNDVAPLKYFNSKVDQYSDDGVTFNGAYGYRWRQADTSVEVRDQLEILIEHLRDNPNSRRAVLQMWNVEDDLMNISESKDVCCNTAIYFSLNNKALDMTITNRSNDLIWGLLGSNFVCFTILQEYMAAMIGVSVGKYYHFTNNLHLYESILPELDKAVVELKDQYYDLPGISYKPLFNNLESLDAEIKGLASDYKMTYKHNFSNTWLQNTVVPMLESFRDYKLKNLESLKKSLNRIESQDWKKAAIDWISSRPSMKGNIL